MFTAKPENVEEVRIAPPSGGKPRFHSPAGSIFERIRSSLMGTDFPSAAQKTLQKGKTRVRPTEYGWGLLFLMFWVPFTAVATANNFLFIIFTMLVGLAIVSQRLGKKNLNCVEVERRFPDEIFAGTQFMLKYLLKTNRRPWGALTLTFAEYPPLEGVEQGTVFLQVPPDGTTAVDSLATVPTRGYHQVEPGVLSSSFPFGLAAYSRLGGPAERILVFPHVVSVDSDVPAWVGSSGKGFERIGRFGTVPFHLREYVPGDPYKHIEWKKTAQTGTLMSKVLSDEEAREIVIRVPGNASERAISRAASLVVYFSKKGTPLKLAGPGFSEGPDRGAKFTRKLLTILACWEDQVHEGAVPSASAGIVVNVDATGKLRWQYAGAIRRPAG
jgi:uncharacterized protein (DUF58 family)